MRTFNALQSDPTSFLGARRYEDARHNLWLTFNRAQENLLRGGLKDESRRREDGKRFPQTRAITFHRT